MAAKEEAVKEEKEKRTGEGKGEQKEERFIRAYEN